MQPQEYMTEIQTTTYTIVGKPKEIIRAAHWEFNNAEGVSNISKPHVTVYKINGQKWELASAKAKAWHRTTQDKVSKIDMFDGVTIERTDSGTNASILKTKRLEYLPAEEKISTSEFVTMQQPGLTITGYGLLGYLNKNWIELHDKITTVYTAH